MILNFNKSKKRRFAFLLLFTALICLSGKINAQVGETQFKHQVTPGAYALTSTKGTFNYLTGGTVANSFDINEEVSSEISIGFTFNVGCDSFTKVFAVNTGYLAFGSSRSFIPSVMNNPGNISGERDKVILAALAPNNMYGNGGRFSYATSGTAPNRVFTAEWKNYKWPGVGVISFQVKLYETSNDIEYCYNPETGAASGSLKATSIGVFRNLSPNIINDYTTINPYNKQQLWLKDVTNTPATDDAKVFTAMTTRPESGQIYRFTDNGVNCGYYGRTVLNEAGGTNATGMKITLTGAGNIQIYRKLQNQIYNVSNDLLTGTIDPYSVPGTQNGLVLSIGDTYYTGGTMTTNKGTYGGKLLVISSTEQKFVEVSPGKFENVLKLAAVKKGLTYYLTVTYSYTAPENKLKINYSVTIPEGNESKDPVRLAHAWDTYLSGNDMGPGFVKGTAPDFIMGVFRLPAYEAFQYVDGVPWSGYFSGYFQIMNQHLGNDLTFDNTIDKTATDNGIGISMNFGSDSGTFSSSSNLLFACPAGDDAPQLKTNKETLCKGTKFNLNDYLNSPLPEGCIAEWTLNSAVVTDPTNVTVGGTYTVTFSSSLFGCTSPTASIIITIDNSCEVCFKTGVTAGTEAGFTTIISTLDRTNATRNWGNSMNGVLILESKEKGFVLTRMASPAAIKNPVEGMIVFDTTENCLKLYNGTSWNKLVQGCDN
ncbi:hypothetical protein GKZ90_0023555 [Flavobacterium sp. MC2016-06]|jgi:hypothetical protein|uniref:hypothetical protein n=1 Tax=Flavobacterium sp. MC2016-06 TaxID=2676308 RepID=UPI0012BAE395|nr:hypothetical protein [Flavobacterium sp. MC2016-06]MBU3862481.1 hypothetical protein [Flavobacterium sp. MC2016-06]